MSTTVEIPDDLATRAERLAVARKTSLQALVEESLREHLDSTNEGTTSERRAIRWVTVEGGLPPGVDVANRNDLHRWLRENPA